MPVGGGVGKGVGVGEATGTGVSCGEGEPTLALEALLLTTCAGAKSSDPPGIRISRRPSLPWRSRAPQPAEPLNKAELRLCARGCIVAG